MRTARRVGSTGLFGASFRRCASCVENSRSLTSCRLVASPLVAIVESRFASAHRLVESGDFLEQLVGLDWLDDVVARTLPQTPNTIGLLILAGAHDDRNVLRHRILG